MKLFYDKYIKLAHIGRGANAHVYKVKHAQLGYIRAIKVLNDYIEDESEKVYQSFLKECRTLLTIGNGCHPNIVRIYGPSLIDNHAIVEMDYIQGMTLDSYIKEKGFIEYDEVKRFIHDIVGALAYTHHDIYSFLMDPDADNLSISPEDGRKYTISPSKEKELVKKYGIAHNDLHSNNVMRRDYDGAFVLLDFGLAVQDGKCIKSSKMADGSPEYQAPEKFDSDTVNPRSDVYSLGILMYELLAGRVPFPLHIEADGRVSQKSVNQVLNKHFSETPEAIEGLRKIAYEKAHPSRKYTRDYPEWLDTVILKCLAKKPEDRFSDARELLNTINSYLSSDSTHDKIIANLEKSISQLEEERNDASIKLETTDKQLQESRQEINRLKEKIATITDQLHQEKSNNEHLIGESSDKAMTPPKRKRIYSRRFLLTLIVLLCCNLGVYYYKDAKLKSVIEDYNALENSISLSLSDSINHKQDSIKKTYVKGGQSNAGFTENRQTIDSLKREISNLKFNGGSNSHRLYAQIDSLNKVIANLKKQPAAAAPKTATKIEYRNSPETQSELNRLRNEISSLKTQVQKERARADRAIEIARK